MKVVINRCFGGFSLSKAAFKELGLPWGGYGSLTETEIKRDDPRLIACVEKLGEAANGDYAKLSVVEIPDDVEWFIDEYDGNETIREKHRTWC